MSSKQRWEPVATPDGTALAKLIHTPSAVAPLEIASSRSAFGPATCSLPVSSVDDAVFMLSYAARMADELKRPDVANRMLSIAATLRFRADAARATERQPEENNLDQTRGGQRSA